jgi:hypothetical protein
LWDAQLVGARQSRIGLATSWLPIVLLPGLSANDTAHSRYLAALGSTVILLAAERHRRKTGSWPTSIATIDPAIIDRLPVDPYSGRSFCMRHRDGQLLIYSIGSNLQDENGAYDPKRWQEKVRDDVGAAGWDVPLRRQAGSGD